jgi:hypothetical protein
MQTRTQEYRVILFRQQAIIPMAAGLAAAATPALVGLRPAIAQEDSKVMSVSQSVSQSAISELWTSWTGMWNGNLDIAQSIIASNFVAHFNPMGVIGPEAVHDPDSVAAWIAQSRAPFTEFRFTVEAGPAIDNANNLVAGRWRATANYA